MYRKPFGLVLILLSLLISSSLLNLGNNRVIVVASPGTITVPDDFPTIQQAINHANHGDLIAVRNGTYNENVIVNKSVSLVGESLSAIIDGSLVGVVVLITAPNVVLTSLTIRNSGYGSYDAGVWVTANNATVTGNEIVDNSWGIGLSAAGGSCQINGNNITGNEHSEWHSWGGGVFVSDSSYNAIVGNTISCLENYGVYLSGTCSYNSILGNTFTNHFSAGLRLACSNNVIHHNNFMESSKQVIVDSGINIWDDDYPAGGNYWSNYTGSDEFSGPSQDQPGSDGIGDSPYVIDPSNQDRYPLMQPFSLVKNLATGLCYVTIQSAIDASETTDGHTIYAPSGVYYESLVVDKAVSLVGESQQTTLIDGRSSGTVVAVTADNVGLCGFTITNSEPTHGRALYMRSAGGHVSDLIITHSYYGIFLENSSDCAISNSLLSNTSRALLVSNSDYITISSNNVSFNSLFGIVLSSSANCRIELNRVYQNSHGIYLDVNSRDNTVRENTAHDNFYGIYFDNSGENNTVCENAVHSNFYGICLYSSNNNAIFHNNFENTNEAYSYNSINHWNNSVPEGNYWSDYNGTDSNGDGIGDTPYLIREDAQDNYPLINPYGSVQNINTGLLYKSIQAAINAAETLDGHTIRIEAGTHREHVVVNKTLTLVGKDKAATIIAGRDDVENVITVAANNVTLTNLSIEAGESTTKKGGIYISLANFTTVYDCIIRNNGDGILLNRSHSSRIDTNTITGNNRGLLLVQSGNTTILHNLIADNAFEGLHLWGSEANYNRISLNEVSHNGYGDPTGLDGISLHLSHDNTISDNVVTLNARDGVRLFEACGNHISGNEIAANLHAGISLLGGAATNATRNVITRNNIQDNDVGISTTPWWAYANSTSILVDPPVSVVGRWEEASAGRSFTVRIYVNNVINLTAFEFRLYYPNALLNCTDVAEGPFLRSGGADTSWPLGVSINNNFNSTHGRVLAPATIFGQTWVSGSGILATVTFVTKASGQAALHLGATTLLDNTPPPNTQPIAHTTFHGTAYVGTRPPSVGQNVIYHNNFLNNTSQIHTTPPSINLWDDGCEGNYWSSYNGSDWDGDGIGDTYLPWEEADQYPLMNLYWNPGDVDHDLDVDIFDIVRAASAYGTTPAHPRWNCHCDIAEPYGTINIFDIVMIAGSYGAKYHS